MGVKIQLKMLSRFVQIVTGSGIMANKALVRTQTTLRFVCAAQFQRYAALIEMEIENEQTN